MVSQQFLLCICFIGQIINIGAIEVERKGNRPSLAISPPLKLPSEEDLAYLPTPLPSSAANTPVAQQFALPSSDAEANAAGRERRTRKSVNYAEPKLNTFVHLRTKLLAENLICLI